MAENQVQNAPAEKVITLSASLLEPFQEHPFRVASGEEMDACQATPSLTQSRTLKQMSQSGTLTREYLHHLLTEEKPNQRQKFFLNQEDVQRYFPKHYTPQQMQQVIIHLLHTWQHKRGYNKDTPER